MCDLVGNHRRQFSKGFLGGRGPENLKSKAEIILFLKDFALGHKAAETSYAHAGAANQIAVILRKRSGSLATNSRPCTYIYLSHMRVAPKASPDSLRSLRFRFTPYSRILNLKSTI